MENLEFQRIDRGTGNNDGSGDSAFDFTGKTNDNFDLVKNVVGELDNKIRETSFEGAKTYTSVTELNAERPNPAEYDTAIVNNRSISDDNGKYSVVGGVWLKYRSLVENEIDVNNTTEPVNGFAIASYRERFNAFEEYQLDEDINYGVKIRNSTSTNFDITLKDFYNAFSYVRVYGVDENVPYKFWFLSRNSSSQGYRFIVSAYVNNLWTKVFDTGVNINIVETEGITHVSYNEGNKRIEFGINYEAIPLGTFIKPDQYRIGANGAQAGDVGRNTPAFVIKKEFVYESLSGEVGGTQYDQSLNTTDNVAFDKVTANEISTSILTAFLPEGNSEPSALLSGQAWIDTSAGRVIKIKA